MISRWQFTLRIGVLELLGQGLTLALGQRLDKSKGLGTVCVSQLFVVEMGRV